MVMLSILLMGFLSACENRVESYARYVEDLADLAVARQGDCEALLPELEAYVKSNQEEIYEIGKGLSDAEVRQLEQRVEEPMRRYKAMTEACREEADFVLALLFEALMD